MKRFVKIAPKPSSQLGKIQPRVELPNCLLTGLLEEEIEIDQEIHNLDTEIRGYYQDLIHINEKIIRKNQELMYAMNQELLLKTAKKNLLVGSK